MRTISSILIPPFVPFLGLVWIFWYLLSILGGVLAVIAFAQVAWLVWLNSRFPLGKVFRAWFNAANWILQKTQELLELLGVKKLLFGIPITP
jgi:hypothetical protein